MTLAALLLSSYPQLLLPLQRHEALLGLLTGGLRHQRPPHLLLPHLLPLDLRLLPETTIWLSRSEECKTESTHTLSAILDCTGFSTLERGQSWTVLWLCLSWDSHKQSNVNRQRVS